MENKIITMLTGRQSGLDHQMSILGKKPKVYDYREKISLIKLKQSFFDYEDIWFAEDSGQLPFEDSKNPIIVSGYFNAGNFRYYVQSSDETDPQYVALRTTVNYAERIAERLEKRGAEKIVIGKEVNQRKLLDLALTLQGNKLEQKVQGFMALPKEAQEREVRRLFEYQTRGNK